MEDASELIYEMMRKVRNLSLDLRPAMLDDFGLFPALGWLFERIHTRMQIEVQADFDLTSEQRFDLRIEIAAFRIIQEALTNVARYASTGQVFVSVEADDFLRIKIEDHGQGFNFESISQRQTLSGGISGMQERARQVGGYVDIYSEPGWGTRITAEIPLPNEVTS